MKRAAILGWVVLAIATAGCGGGNGGGDALAGEDLPIGFDVPAVDDAAAPDEGGEPDAVVRRDLPSMELPDTNCGVTLENYFDRLIDALAGFYARCSPGDRINFWQNPQNTRWMLEGLVRPMEVGYRVRIDQGKLQLDTAVACTYLGLLEDGDCNATRTMNSGLVGTAGPDGACGVDEECPAGYFCRFANATTCEGACAPRVGEGQLCDLGGCQPGFSCRLNDADEFRCVASLYIREPGQDCDPNTDVCARSFCDGSRCRELPTSGVSCSPGSYCRDGWCDRNLGICKPYVGEGGACESWTSCEDGMYCLPFPDERCKPRLDLGETCDPTRNSFDFPGVSLACAGGLCDKLDNVCTDTPPASACD
jgi:hypothetical protein